MAVRPFNPERDGKPVYDQTEIEETLSVHEAKNLGLIEGYHLRFPRLCENPDAFRGMEPELYVKTGNPKGMGRGV